MKLNQNTFLIGVLIFAIVLLIFNILNINSVIENNVDDERNEDVKKMETILSEESENKIIKKEAIKPNAAYVVKYKTQRK